MTISQNRIMTFEAGVTRAFREDGCKIEIRDNGQFGEHDFIPTVNLWSAEVGATRAQHLAEAIKWAGQLAENLMHLDITIISANDPLINNADEYRQWCEFYYLMTKARDTGAIISSFTLNAIEEVEA